MSYSESEADLLLFSSDRTKLDEFTSKIRKKIDEKGVQYEGPISLPVVDSDELSAFLYHIKYPDSEELSNESEFSSWLFDAADSEESIEAMITAAEEGNSLFARKYQILGNTGIKSALSFQLPDSVYAVVELGQREHHKGGDHDLYTWDPNIDHIPTHPDGW